MKPYKGWLLKAYSDLKSAKKLMEGDNKIPDTAIYHAQQSAEKALKAYLSLELTGYDIAFRYPDLILEPDEEDVFDAIKKAEKILTFVKDHIQRELQ